MAAFLYFPSHQLEPPPSPAKPVLIVSPEGNQSLFTPGMTVVADLASYRDELYAFLMFQHFRATAARLDAEVFLTYSQSGNEYEYSVQAALGENVLGAPYLLAQLAGTLVSPSNVRTVNDVTLDTFKAQTKVLTTAYALAGRKRPRDLTSAALASYLKRFVRFKSAVDPRIRRQIEPVPEALTQEQAATLASDIVTVANFYELPLYVFLGIGAMENNYMSVAGDLEHKTWKRRAEPGDVVLRRRAGRVLVLNSSAGVWQITRETLRSAHRLYLADQRDYSSLPSHLVPPAKLDVNRVTGEALTTYAGLLLRDLLDRCNGSVEMAVGAYNGGLRKPNLRYAAGVQIVADYARGFVESAAALGGRPAAGVRFLTATSQP